MITVEIAPGTQIRMVRAGVGRRVVEDEYEEYDDEDDDDDPTTADRRRRRRRRAAGAVHVLVSDTDPLEPVLPAPPEDVQARVVVGDAGAGPGTPGALASTSRPPTA